MSISIGVGRLPLAAAAMVGAAVAGSAEAGVRMFNVNWTLPSSGELYISLNNLTTGPTTSATIASGWDMRITSPSARSSLDFSFPQVSTPSGPTANSRYGMMRAPGSVFGSGANLPLGTLVQQTASFSDGGAATFGSGAHEWRLNGENYFGFKLQLGSSTSSVYGWARMVVGSLPGQFTITNFGYESMTGAPIAVGAGMPVPGPGGLAVLGAAALVARRSRR
jgi:hypothetical protein